MPEMLAILWREDNKILLHAPYNEHFLYDIKSIIPKRFRRWDPVYKLWIIDELVEDEVYNLIDRYFDLKELSLKNSSLQQVNYYGGLLRHLSIDGLKRVWRVVAKELHPDLGGDSETFIQARVAYENLIGVST